MENRRAFLLFVAAYAPLHVERSTGCTVRRTLGSVSPEPGHEPLSPWATLTLARDVEYTDYSLEGAEACAFEFVAWCRQGRPTASVPAWIRGQREYICRPVVLPWVDRARGSSVDGPWPARTARSPRPRPPPALPSPS